jgi:UDP-glucose 4-epimerase
VGESVSQPVRYFDNNVGSTLALLQAVRPLWPGGVDEAALYGANLVSGVVDARRPDPAQDAASTHR